MITAKIIADSVNLRGDRLTTFQLRYPRFIHAEFMTHRVFSRNARSSRAVPTNVLLKEIETQPAMPVVWGKNEPGMQASVNFEGKDAIGCEAMWRRTAQHAADYARGMLDLGLHKQIVNRVIEPFTFIDVVVSSTEWENWYGLRCHKDAQPEIQALANAMFVEHRDSAPDLLKPGQWHLPYYNKVLDDKRLSQFLDDLWLTETDEPVDSKHKWGLQSDKAQELRLKISVARCARVSYRAFDGSTTPLADEIMLHNRLVAAQPLHASPAEHQATPDEMVPDTYSDWHWKNAHLHGNFNGWVQYRKTLLGEHAAEFPPYNALDFH